MKVVGCCCYLKLYHKEAKPWKFQHALFPVKTKETWRNS